MSEKDWQNLLKVSIFAQFHSSDIYKIAHFCYVMFCIVIMLLKYYKNFFLNECESIFVFMIYCVMGILN